MVMIEKKDEAQDAGAKPALIELVTENGFSVVRSAIVDANPPNGAGEYRFVVRNPHGWEREVVVEFDLAAISLAQRRRRSPLSPNSSFWINCAERALAIYLWEKDQYPPNGRLILEELCLDDLEVARRWNSD
jgi:hypothetical protein